MDSTFTPLHRGGSGSPLILLHGFTDTWRTGELVLPALEKQHDVLALTLAGHGAARSKGRRKRLREPRLEDRTAPATREGADFHRHAEQPVRPRSRSPTIVDRTLPARPNGRILPPGTDR